MPTFASWLSYWQFARAVMRERRYVRSREVERFLRAVLATSRARVKTIPEARYLWRAQAGHIWESVYDEDDEYVTEIQAPYAPGRMKPLMHSATEGRANPKGIPYLYLANRRETAMAEVRPPLGALISLGQFRTQRALRVVDCSTTERKTLLYIDEPPPRKRAQAVWVDIDRAFSSPIGRSDDTADYVPTQIIAELFRSKGHDGILYRSAYSGGYNVALFDLDAAELVSCALYEAKDITFDFREAGNHYSVKASGKSAPGVTQSP